MLSNRIEFALSDASFRAASSLLNSWTIYQRSDVHNSLHHLHRKLCTLIISDVKNRLVQSMDRQLNDADSIVFQQCTRMISRHSLEDELPDMWPLGCQLPSILVVSQDAQSCTCNAVVPCMAAACTILYCESWRSIARMAVSQRAAKGKQCAHCAGAHPHPPILGTRMHVCMLAVHLQHGPHALSRAIAQ